MPKKTYASEPKPLYQSKPSRPESGIHSALPSEHEAPPKRIPFRAPADDLDTMAVPTHAFVLRDDGTIGTPSTVSAGSSPPDPRLTPDIPQLIHSSDTPFLRLYQGNSLELLDAIAAKYPDGRFDMIFADPPYFLSNGGITCHAGKMVKVDKGDWDKSRGPEVTTSSTSNGCGRCQRVLKPNGTIWVSGTHHVIFSIGYASTFGDGMLTSSVGKSRSSAAGVIASPKPMSIWR